MNFKALKFIKIYSENWKKAKGLGAHAFFMQNSKYGNYSNHHA
jgi:hypothetical protein